MDFLDNLSMVYRLLFSRKSQKWVMRELLEMLISLEYCTECYWKVFVHISIYSDHTRLRVHGIIFLNLRENSTPNTFSLTCTDGVVGNWLRVHSTSTIFLNLRENSTRNTPLACTIGEEGRGNGWLLIGRVL